MLLDVVVGFLVINPRSGDESPTAEELGAAAERIGIRVQVAGPDDDLAALLAEAEGDALGVAGGDGSTSAAAAVAVERGLPLVCVPFGTRNHFARDLGLDPDDPLAALAAFGDGVERRVDVGRVNGKVFLNNVSFGLYAGLVHERERHRRRRNALAGLRALRLALRRHRPPKLAVDGRPSNARIVLVANNDYRLDLFSIGERDSLEGGVLHLYEAEGLLPARWRELTGERFEITADGAGVQVAIDGDPEELESPLRFEIDPRALRVLLPAEPGR